MLEQLLSLVAAGGLHSYDDLAARLGVSRPLLDMMLADLGRLGYLRQAGAECGSGCAGCGQATCGPSGLVWALTDKGLKAVQ